MSEVLPLAEGFAPHPSGQAWLDALKRHGLDRYRAQGLPHRRTEAWKYTPVAKLVEKGGFVAPATSAEATATPLLQGSVVITVHNAHALVSGPLPEGLSVTTGAPHADVKALLGALTPAEAMPFAALNTALIEDVVVLRVAAGQRITQPVALHVRTDAGAASHPRVLLLLEEGAALTVLEVWGAADGGASLTNGVVEAHVAAGAVLDHTLWQREHADAVSLGYAAVRLAQEARLHATVLHDGARLARREVHVTVAGAGAHATLSGLYLGRGEGHADLTTFVDHAVADATSDQLVKGILDDNSRGVFQGKVLVRRHSQRTDAQQQHRALLLSRAAEVNAKPELEIYADDVACAHGSAVGALDPAQLFYLTSRGIDADTARRLLVRAFAETVFARIHHDDIRTALRDAILGASEEVVL